jgi:hypothetical protein
MERRCRCYGAGCKKNKSLGDSIKKHIFHKNVVKSLKKVQVRVSGDDNWM